jgi:hypothetical protein
MEHPNTVSAAGNKYVLDIIDDFSSYAWSIPLPAKSDAFPVLQNWERAHKLECGLKVGIYCSDNGELKTGAMREWLLSCGTQHQFTAPYTFAQNGRVECLHCTLMGKARAMHTTCNVPANHWDEFVLTACYLSNRTPVSSQDSHMPYEHWYSKTPDLTHLHEIGCHAFVLIQNHHNPKINNRSVKCVLISYSMDSKAYWCYHHASHKVCVSYHISFIESHNSVDTPLHPGITIVNAPSLPVSVTMKHCASVTDAPDEDDHPLPNVAAPSTTMIPHLPSMEPTPQHSSWVPVPSECRCDTEGIPYISATHRQAISSIAKANGLDTLPPIPESVKPPKDLASKLAHLADVFSAIPDDFSSKHPSDPASYAEVMNSEYAAEWTQAMQEEFTSLCDLRVYKLVP